MDSGELLRILKAQPPNALIIDLSRSPAQGRDLGVALRIHGSTRKVPLPKKLGIKEGKLLLLAQAPEGIQDTLGPLPDGVRIVTRYSSNVELILWFVRREMELEAGIEKWASRVGKGLRRTLGMAYAKFLVPGVRDPGNGVGASFSHSLVEKCGLCWYPILTPMVL